VPAGEQWQGSWSALRSLVCIRRTRDRTSAVSGHETVRIVRVGYQLRGLHRCHRVDIVIAEYDELCAPHPIQPPAA
jgi:hypothetical protein